MATTHLLSAHVSAEMKARFRSLAEQQQITEAVLLKQLADSAIRSAGVIDADVLKPARRSTAGVRTYALLHPDDRALLKERAASRQMGAATYISVLVRSHLRNLSPLPKAELMALKHSVAELGAIARNLSQVIPLLHQGTGTQELSLGSLMATVKVCEALRSHTKELLKANALSWRTGDESAPT